jgi:glycosyltransferase involved in cell wall biosynthesis
VHIAHVVKPYIRVPPERYGAVERVLSLLAREQARTHHVTMFATGDAKLPEEVELIPFFPREMGNQGYDRYIELAQVLHAFQLHLKRPYDIVHAHAVDAAIPLAPMLDIPMVYSAHSILRRETEALIELCDQERVSFVFLTEAHRASYPQIERASVIPYGIPAANYPFYDVSDKRGYLAFVGALTEAKGVLDAISVARMTGTELRIAGKVRDPVFFEEHIRPCLEDPLITFLGEVNDHERNMLLGQAKAMLFPIHWSEPFGLVLLESLVVGTPVIAYARGSVPEILTSNVGCVVCSPEEMTEAVERVQSLRPLDCRSHVAERFPLRRMIASFQRLYAHHARLLRK